MPLRPALFLDRDGTLNHDPGYLSDPDRMVPLPGVARAIAQVRRMGFLVVVVSNQSGVGRGYFTLAQLDRVNGRLRALLEAEDVEAHLDALYTCPHRPPAPGEAGCECRKPRPGLLLLAARELGIDLAHSWMVGDRELDVEAGRAAGVNTIRISETPAPESAARFIVRDLPEAVAVIGAHRQEDREDGP